MESNRFQLLAQIGAVLRNFPDLILWESLSSGQILSKKWLIENLERLDLELGTVFVLGGWWGILPAMMFESDLRINKVHSFDLDPACAPVADTFNRPYVMSDWKFKASTADMLKLSYDLCRFSTLRADGSAVEVCEVPDTIVNTSCEHIGDFSGWWNRLPRGKLLVLQSNDFEAGRGHCNCVKSLEEFSAQAPMGKTLFQGELDLPEYKRFLLIGYK